MGTVRVGFFDTEQSQLVLRRFVLALESVPESTLPIPRLKPLLQQFFRVLISNTAAFDEYCSANIEWIGRSFLDQLTAFPDTDVEKKPDALEHIFVLAYRFLCELEFTQSGDLSFELSGIKTFVIENLEKFVGMSRQQLIYSSYLMPASVVKKLINSPVLVEFKSFAETAKSASELKVTWDKEIKEKSTEINELREGLSKLKTTYNFVGLVKGFENLADTKKNERSRSFWTLLVLGAIMLSPVVIELIFVARNLEIIDSHKTTLVYALPGLITLEVILLYFFRVVLSNFRSITTQLLQINLRMSLCQFIQSYSEYSAKIKERDPSALEKFENLIFSGIISESGALPSTLDGMEQLAKLISSVRGKGGS